MPIDKEVAVTMLNEYQKTQPADFRPSFLNEMEDVQDFVDDLFEESMFVSEAKVNDFLNGFKAKDVRKLLKDPAFWIYCRRRCF